MFKKKVLTVGQYVERRSAERYGRKIRVIGSNSYRWWDNMDAIVKSVKVTKSYIIIFI
jgi:hypothetical protein